MFGDKYLTTQAKKFNIAERKISLSGDSFDVKDESDTRVYIGDGNAFRQKKMIRIIDARDKTVLATVGKDLEGDGYFLKKGETNQVLYHFKAKDDFAKTESISGRVEMFKGGSGSYPQFYISRILDAKTYAVMITGVDKEVARITHDFNLGKRDIWTCAVPEGVDEALMVSITILIDEILESS